MFLSVHVVLFNFIYTYMFYYLSDILSIHSACSYFLFGLCLLYFLFCTDGLSALTDFVDEPSALEVVIFRATNLNFVSCVFFFFLF